MKKKNQSIGTWLKTLEEPYREKALAYAKKEKRLSDIRANIFEALTAAFIFDKTEEGREYWLDCLCSAVRKARGWQSMTVREHFGCLPKEIRAKAMANTMKADKSSLDEVEPDPVCALIGSFRARESNEGFDYWQDVIENKLHVSRGEVNALLAQKEKNCNCPACRKRKALGEKNVIEIEDLNDLPDEIKEDLKEIFKKLFGNDKKD